MSDFTTTITNDGGLPALGWLMAGPDLATDDGLRTAVLISLFTDRLANADDELPDNSGDRRGWWGDFPNGNPYSSVPDKPDLIGSRLWLLSRALQTQDTLNRGIAYCEEALQWLIDDGVAQSVRVTGAWQGLGRVLFSVAIARKTNAASGAANDNQRFDVLWTQTLAA